MKKTFKVVFTLFCFSFLLLNVNAKSLKQLKEELDNDIKNEKSLIQKSKEIQNKINKMNKEMEELSLKIENDEQNIIESKKKIEELDIEISEKEKEIDNLMSFEQISNGDNVYLEYVFNSESFTDFIYRSAIVEQLTKYNDEMIDKMNNLILENKATQKQLEKSISESEESIDEVEELLKKYGLDMNDIDEEKRDISADIKARKAEIAEYEKAYKKAGCKEDVDVKDCVDVPPAGKFVRPLKSGYMSSMYGMRYHPTRHVWTMHNGVDIAGNKMGTKVYAAASGKVNKIVRRSSCGGNMVYIQHTIKGKHYRTVYMHLHSIKVKLGQIVTASTVIGTVGGGESYDRCTTGPHLHFGLLKGWDGYTYYNPKNYVDLPNKGGRFYSRW